MEEIISVFFVHSSGLITRFAVKSVIFAADDTTSWFNRGSVHEKDAEIHSI